MLTYDNKKPPSMSMKSFLVRKLSVRMGIDESVIETVINHQFVSCMDAMASNDTIEISGFGKMYFNRNKAIKKYKKELEKEVYFQKELENVNNTPAKQASLHNKLTNTRATIAALSKRLNINQTPNVNTFADLRGMEEQPVSFFGDGGESGSTSS